MVQCGGGSRLLFESLHAFVILSEFAEEKFQRQLAAEPPVLSQINWFFGNRCKTPLHLVPSAAECLKAV
jgi:hypothetical protein